MFQKLEECYDQMVHPQKRRLLKSVLEATIGRVLELKNELMNFEASNFNFYDDILTAYKLIPVRHFFCVEGCSLCIEVKNFSRRYELQTANSVQKLTNKNIPNCILLV